MSTNYRGKSCRPCHNRGNRAFPSFSHLNIGSKVLRTPSPSNQRCIRTPTAPESQTGKSPNSHRRDPASRPIGEDIVSLPLDSTANRAVEHPAIFFVNIVWAEKKCVYDDIRTTSRVKSATARSSTEDFMKISPAPCMSLEIARPK